MNTPCFNIAAVERDTGLSKDVLRMWERRYGFPTPERDSHGERRYPAEQVDRLRLIKRLMDQGHRPGKLIATPVEALKSLTPRRPAAGRDEQAAAQHDNLDELLGMLKAHDVSGYQHAMQQRLLRQGFHRFVQDTVAPLTQQVGMAWEEGRFEVFEEHLFTEQTKRLLRQAISSLGGGARSPRIILTTVPDEQHLLGLLMAEGLFTLEGAECIALGTQMPLLEISRAVSAHRADIVALSFSSAFPRRQINGLLLQLRQTLPEHVALWVGGGGVADLNSTAHFSVMLTLDDALNCLADWRASHDAATQTST